MTQEVFDRYRAALTGASLVRNAESVHREAVLAWTQLPEGLAGHPAVQVRVPHNGTLRKRGRQPLESFPTSFLSDLETFRRWCVTADPLDDAARPKALRAQTVISYLNVLHTAADAAVRSGVPIGEMTSRRVLAGSDVYVRSLRQLLADGDTRATVTTHGVATVVPIIARDFLRLPPEQIAELKAIKAKLPKLRPGLTPKNRDLLAAFYDKDLLGRFLALGDELWKEALPDHLPRNQRLVRAQMALLIGILQITPLRQKNMRAVRFDRDITWPNGPNGPAMIQMGADEHKTEVDYIGELPLELSSRLHHYRTKLAPAITGVVPTHLFIKVNGKPKVQASVTSRLVVAMNKRLGVHLTMHQFRHDGLWASAKGRPATGDALYCAFQREIASSLGLHLTLHDARRIAVTTWSMHDPVNAAGAKDLLGDRSDRVIAEHYNLASGIEASRKMAEVVARLRAK